ILCGEALIFALHGWLTGALAEDRSCFKGSSFFIEGGLLKKDIFCFKRIRISNKLYTNTGIENNRNIGGMRYEDQ
ncbi:hypothetical protein, partial [Peribacillus simplex]|uniref:hypothetical protein n=1 Tax=Peribacillus simplex TaxID=1478 RepID=UPI003CE87C57